MADPRQALDLKTVARVLAALSREERDELLESLTITICNNPHEVQTILGCYIVEHEFQTLTAQLGTSGVREVEPQ